MDQSSPTDSASTQNRGGRPREWTVDRIRRLIRLYLYTPLSLTQITKVLEEDCWKPGKEAAHKVLHSVIGHDPRWIKPNKDEARRIVCGLKESRRAQGLSMRKRSSFIATPSPAVPTQSTSAFAQTTPSTLATLEASQSAQPQPIPTEPSLRLLTREQSYRLTPQPLSRRETVLSEDTDVSIGSFRRRLPSNTSLSQAKDIFRVLKRWTISADPDNQLSASNSPSVHFNYPYSQSFSDEFDASRAVPGDFLNDESFETCPQCAMGSPSHEAQTCWCKVYSDISAAENFQALHRACMEAVEDPSRLRTINKDATDELGNTVFHHLAAVSGARPLFLQVLSHELSDPNSTLRARNSAGQTFLHVLHPDWFISSELRDLFSLLHMHAFDVYATDVYGRNVFHFFKTHGHDQNKLKEMSMLFDQEKINRRDASGSKPLASRASRGANLLEVPQSNSSRAGSPMEVVNEESPTELRSGNFHDTIYQHHARLLKLIRNSSENPGQLIEDAQGRNGLHCLAEAVMGTRVIQEFAAGPRPTKRKFEETEQSPADAVSLSQRLNYLEVLLHARVDVNHYDLQGYTPLMAFVRHIKDGTRDDKDLGAIIKRLIQAGADLEARNRDGETALLVAARTGQKFALRVLIENGANVHARNARGLGALALLDDLLPHSRADEVLYARLEGCRNVLTNGKNGNARAVQYPTVLQEWTARPQRI